MSASADENDVVEPGRLPDRAWPNGASDSVGSATISWHHTRNDWES